MTQQKKQARSSEQTKKTKHKKAWTLAHVTHEAIEHIGGIGTVLEGLMTSPAYREHIGRSILFGPLWGHLVPDEKGNLGDHGEVLYAASHNIDKTNGLASAFSEIEKTFNIAIVYGRRTFDPPGQQRHGEAEFVLIDVRNYTQAPLNALKFKLWEEYALDSSLYEHSWDYEEYLRLAEPAIKSLEVLLAADDWPCMVLGHEYMGMPTCLAAAMDPQKRFRTFFHGHECASARYIVENHPGHDTMFYNLLDEAWDSDQTMESLFPALTSQVRHGLISRSYACDAILAVGDRTRDELQFLNKPMRQATVDLVYNGLPAFKLTNKGKQASREMLRDYTSQLLEYKPDILMTHVTRPVISKGLWRDVRVCHELDKQFAQIGKTGVLYILTSAGGVRTPEQVQQMEAAYGWPAEHREGYPDLVGPEVGLYDMIEPFNAEHKQIKIVLVNQFGWTTSRIGKRLSAEMSIAHLRQAADVEFGMATYEPFGISPLEPLGAGAICVISNVCGCAGLVQDVTGSQGTDNVIIADFTQLDQPMTPEALLSMTQDVRDRIEHKESARVAKLLFERLPWRQKEREGLMKAGQKLVAQMGWDQIMTQKLLPVFKRVMN